jgi:outer membrane protein assembly factor BamB
MNMGAGLGGGQLNNGKGKGKAAELPGAVAAANTGVQAAPAKAEVLAQIGPDGVSGNVLYAWDPIARKERWRAAGAGAGPFAGGSVTTAGNLVFSSVNNRLLAFKADTGEKLLELDLQTAQMGPPISFMIDGKQYITVSGGPQGGGGRGAAQAGAPVPLPQPARMLVLTLDGKAPIPGAN